jgi:hypothetical protein
MRRRDSSGATKFTSNYSSAQPALDQAARCKGGIDFLFRADTECGLMISGTLPDRAQFIDSRLQLPPAQFFRTLGQLPKETQTKSR